jgi:hypothetical protein
MVLIWEVNYEKSVHCIINISGVHISGVLRMSDLEDLTAEELESLADLQESIEIDRFEQEKDGCYE